jgi:diguanylate cyclase (GGDEF)-like protein
MDPEEVPIIREGSFSSTPESTLAQSQEHLGQTINELQHKLQDMKVLQDFTSTLMLFHQGVDEILWDVARLAVARLGLEDCVIYLCDHENGELVQCSAYGPKNPHERQILNPIRLRIGQGIVGSVVASGKLEMIADTRKDPRYVCDDQPRLSELAVPILNDGKVIGVIDSEHSQLDFFTPWHRDIFLAIAAMAGSRIAAARFEQERYRLATQDPLTGLANRGELMRELKSRLDNATSTVAVILLDLDHFGDMNDSRGNDAGDELLRAISERIQKQSPAGSLVARSGGDEFVVVLNVDLEQSKVEAEKLRECISQVFAEGSLVGLHIACSAGISVGINGNSAEDILNQSNFAMYEAKRKGRGQMCVHDSVMANHRRREQRIVQDMVRALESNSKAFNFHIQPMYALPSCKIVAAEVLARWMHPELGPIGPAEFVLAAERTGNIHLLGETIFAQAFECIHKWKSNVQGILFHVNVSPIQIQKEQFVPQLLRQLEKAQVPPNMIACEVTESALLGDEALALRVLDSIVQHGMKLVLDDFGTGYASLSTLMRYPFSSIKIDRQFVKGLPHEASARTIVSTVLALSREMDLVCTAEGVETNAQLQVLQDMGCPLIQGRILSDAVTPDAFEKILQSR